MKFVVDKSLFKEYPGLRVGCIVITGINIPEEINKDISYYLSHSVSLINEKYHSVEVENISMIQSSNKYFKNFDAKYCSSIANLTKRVLLGSKIPIINNLVGLINSFSLKYLLPIGAHDLDNIVGDLFLGYPEGNLPFLEMGEIEESNIDKNEVCYFDSEKILTRHWMWRQCQQAKIDVNSKNIFIPIDIMSDISDKDLSNIIDEMSKLLIYYFGGKCYSFILNSKKSEFAFPPLESESIPYIKSEKDILIEKLLSRGIMNIYPSDSYLRRELLTRKLTIYLGIDPTGPSLHIGHAISLLKLREFQALGHKIYILIGNFTAQIGDPTDKGAVRKSLSLDDVMKNCETYKSQAEKIIKFDGENPAEFVFNHDWLSTLSFKDVIDLASKFTVQQMLERDMFVKRMKENKPIFLHEFLYPLMQGYDSVYLNIDGEVGGNDQTFNMLAGRTLVKKMQNFRDKFVITVKILADSNGEKMGKTTGNMIRLDDSPDQMYGSVMSWTDGMILTGLELCTNIPIEEIIYIKQKIENGLNPRDMKMLLAREIVSLYYDKEKASMAELSFISKFQKKELSSDIEEFAITDEMTIVEVLEKNNLIKTRNEARRLASQNAIKINDTVCQNIFMTLENQRGNVLKIGKIKFIRLI